MCLWLSALALAIGQAGRWVELADLVNLLLPWWIAAGTFGLILVIVLGRGGRVRGWPMLLPAFVLMAATVDSGLQLVPLPSAPAATPNTRTLKIVSFNLWKDNRTPAVSAQWLEAQNADIIVLVEAAGAAASIPVRLAATYPYRASCSARSRCSTIILSRIRPVAVRPLARGDVENRKTLSAVVMEFGVGDGAFAVAAVHFSRPVPFGSQDRDIAELETALLPYRSRRLVVAGDFNAGPFMFAMRRLHDTIAVRPVSMLAPTWPVSGAPMVPPLFSFDRIAVNNGWYVERAGAGPATGSDHRPVWASLVMK